MSRHFTTPNGEVQTRRHSLDPTRVYSNRVEPLRPDSPLVLSNPPRFGQLVEAARREGRPLPYLYGSQRRYRDAGGLAVECPDYRRRESA
jgi:hypothetical protein